MSNNKDIAIIGIAGKFPKSHNVDELWNNIMTGENCITRNKYIITSEDGYDYVNAYGCLNDIQLFDRDFFEISAGEARNIDPQERLLMQLSYEALEDAGCNYVTYPGTIGIICGSYANESYFKRQFVDDNGKRHWDSTISEILYSGTALATRIAYKFNFNGPSLILDTACSTSLAAVHYACMILRNMEADIMLVGGVNIYPEQSGYVLVDGMTSKNGIVRSFDRDATGMVPANGVGVVVLKRLKDALKDKDHVYAVIKGSAVNNDGDRKIGFTAPSVDGQVEVIERAIKDAEICKEDIVYIETHGTATPLGDAIEIRALNKVFDNESQARSIAIGSLKSNCGHMNIAAGIAGLIKGIMVLKEGYIPPTVNVDNDNPEININLPIYIEKKGKKLPAKIEKPCVGISSFGIGGNNAHVILQRYESKKKNVVRQCLLLLSAKNNTALRKLVNIYQDIFSKVKPAQLIDIAYTLSEGRQHYAERKCFITSIEEGKIIREIHCSSEKRKIDNICLVFDDDSYDYESLKQLAGENLLFKKLLLDWVRKYNAVTKKNVAINDFEKDEFEELRKFAYSFCLAKAFIVNGVRPQEMIGGERFYNVIKVLNSEKTLEQIIMEFDMMSKCLESDTTYLQYDNVNVSFQLHIKSMTFVEYLSVLGRLWEGGLELELSDLYPDNVEKVSIPTYPFDLVDCSYEGNIIKNQQSCPIQTYELFWKIKPLSKGKRNRLTNIVYFCSFDKRDLWNNLLQDSAQNVHVLNSLSDIKEIVKIDKLIIESAVLDADGIRLLSDYYDNFKQLYIIYTVDKKAKLNDLGNKEIALAYYFNHHYGNKVFVLGVNEFDSEVVRDMLITHEEQVVAYYNGERMILSKDVIRGKTSNDEYELISYDDHVTEYFIANTENFIRLITNKSSCSRNMILDKRFVEEITKLEEKIDRKENIPSVFEIPNLNEVYDKLCIYGAGYYINLGQFENGTIYSFEEILSKLSVIEGYKYFVQYLLQILCDGEMALKRDNSYQILTYIGKKEFKDCISEAISKVPDFKSYIKLFERCVENYQFVFSGKIPGNSVIYPDGNFNMLYEVERQIPNTSRIETYITICKEIYVKLLTENSKYVKILEVGGGTGRLTWPLLGYIGHDKNIEYYFTDIGNGFLAEARREAERRGIHNIKFYNFDLEKDYREQHFYDNEFDCIIGIEVIQATRNIDLVLKKLYKLLKANGNISMIQTFKEHDIVQMIYGYAPGYWNFNFDERRIGKGMNMKADEWKTAYLEAGFANVTVLNHGYRKERDDVGIIIANKIEVNNICTDYSLENICSFISKEFILALNIKNEINRIGETNFYRLLDSLLNCVDERDIYNASILLSTPVDVDASIYVYRFVCYMQNEAMKGKCSWTICFYNKLTSEMFDQMRCCHDRPLVLVDGVQYINFQGNKIEKKEKSIELIHCIYDILGTEDVKETDNLFELGFDSLSILSLKSKIRSQFDCELNVSDFYDYETIGELNDYINSVKNIADKEYSEEKHDSKQDISDLLREL
uniref:beta-ketoacyl synthase N-terminal-like domain-containing protein n=1 Tax=Enterocloster clostridioformis TaxID=1531 RepID=UPI0025A550CC|nr:beta-ketoacyl synthase N-terminal-like domain-containing protein [Enterocloster clostridioformis]